MKFKIIASIVCVLYIMTIAMSCADSKVIDGIKYDTYGLINKDDNKHPDIKYELVIGNIVWSCILVQTVIAPIYFLGFSIYEPVRKKHPGEK